jgi:hypothetical protein
MSLADEKYFNIVEHITLLFVLILLRQLYLICNSKLYLVEASTAGRRS